MALKSFAGFTGMLTLLFFSALTQAQTNDLGWTLDSALKQIDRQADDFETAMSDFTGLWSGADETSQGEIAGRFYVNKRGEIKLISKQPAQRQVLIKGKYLYDYDPVKALVEKFYLPKHKSKLLPFARLGFAQTGRDLKDNYLVTLLGEDQIDGRRVLGLELTPKKDEVRAVVSRLEIWIDQAAWIPVRQIISHVSSGQVLTLNYSATATNLALNKKLFDDRWPKGTDVIKR